MTTDISLNGAAKMGELILLNALPQLHRAADQIAGPSRIDPGDLLSEAIVSVYAHWGRGQGPTEKVAAYVMQSMRNRVKDEWKAARSREVPLPDELNIEDNSGDLLDQIELHREHHLLVKSIRELAPDQQKVLVHTAVLGLAPRDLVEVLARPASAISSLLKRAKATARRNLLRNFLTSGIRDSDCARYVDELVEAASDSPDSISNSHLTDCSRCRSALAEFYDYSGTKKLFEPQCA